MGVRPNKNKKRFLPFGYTFSFHWASQDQTWFFCYFQSHASTYFDKSDMSFYVEVSLN